MISTKDEENPGKPYVNEGFPEQTQQSVHLNNEDWGALTGQFTFVDGLLKQFYKTSPQAMGKVKDNVIAAESRLLGGVSQLDNVPHLLDDEYWRGRAKDQFIFMNGQQTSVAALQSGYLKSLIAAMEANAAIHAAARSDAISIAHSTQLLLRKRIDGNYDGGGTINDIKQLLAVVAVIGSGFSLVPTAAKGFAAAATASEKASAVGSSISAAGTLSTTGVTFYDTNKLNDQIAAGNTVDGIMANLKSAVSTLKSEVEKKEAEVIQQLDQIRTSANTQWRQGQTTKKPMENTGQVGLIPQRPDIANIDPKNRKAIKEQISPKTPIDRNGWG